MWNKLTRYQHHCNFLKTCIDRNVIPKGFNLKFNLALNVDNLNFQDMCTRLLQNTSRELCHTTLKITQERVKTLQRELQLSRARLFEVLDHTRATTVWNQLQYKNYVLNCKLRIIEERKLNRTIPLLNLNADNEPATATPTLNT